jgi:filamentous hemagglutinin family protein
MLRKSSIALLICWCYHTPLSAQVTLDGTLGRAGALPGPNYQIGADLGQQHGGNLFHSFRDFNLQSHESATFSGPANVQNIISRVTGGNPSNIDGTLRSTIPNANLYFLNPYGIMFGPNAKLDVQGGFHASTADYLRLSDGGRFEARQPGNSLLTVAPIAAFGFLTDSPATIQTQSSKLSVPPDQTLSLIGGDLHLTSDIPLTADNSQFIPTVASESILAAEHGQINLASLASHGEVIPSDNDLTLQGRGGKITLTNTLVELSGHSGGAAFIRAGQFVLDNAIIRSNTFGNQEGKNINLKVTEAAYLNGVNSEISVTTISPNSAGGILIEAPYLAITNALINTGSAAAGDAGPIEIHANQVFLKDAATIASGVIGTGRSGDLTFNITDRLSLSGFYPGFRLSHGQAYENPLTMILSISLGIGQSGNIWVNTPELNLNSSELLTETYGMGRGGDITINAQSVHLLEGGRISSMTYQLAPAGNIRIQVAGQLYLAGWAPVVVKAIGRTWTILPSVIGSGTVGGNGKGGIIDIQANEVILTEGGQIGANSSNNGTGEAGEVLLKANTLQLTDGGNITTSAEHAGGGDIHLTVANQLYLRQGQLTTSVASGTGDGGNITIDNPQFVVLNKGQIKAQADAGHGGNIHIVAQQFLKTPDSLISASSRLGIDGQVRIESPDQHIGDTLLASPKEFMDVSSLLPRLCEEMSFEEFLNRSTFFVYPIAGSTLSPYDLKPSHAFRSFPKLPTAGLAKVSQERRAIESQRLAWLTGCHS